MADTKISALAAATTAASANELPINEAGVSRKLTVALLGAFIPTLGVYAPGSFTVLTAGWAGIIGSLILTGAQRATIQDTGRLRIN